MKSRWVRRLLLRKKRDLYENENEKKKRRARVAHMYREKESECSDQSPNSKKVTIVAHDHKSLEKVK